MRNAEYFMKLHYPAALRFDPEGYWIAEHPDLPGCQADGQTAQEAIASLEVSRELWIESSLATGNKVPEPAETPQYSGKLLLRIPKSLHRDLAVEAEADGVSLNSYIGVVLAGRFKGTEPVISSAQPLAQTDSNLHRELAVIR